jgi:aryl-alcohol dehydrogenase-like predicted oxidoreductase
LVGKALARYGREKFVLATKFGIGFEDGKRIVSGKSDFIQTQLAQSLERLNTPYIDLYYMHRMDPATPIEETMLTLKSLVEAGKIRYIGLSECSPAELRRAHAIHPVTAIQKEWSLQTRDLENDIVPVARELGVGIVAYSPLGRGFLTAPSALDTLDPGDWRRHTPRYQNLEANKEKTKKFFELAAAKGCTPAQLALAWVHSQGDDVFPIPGTKSSTRIEENALAYTYVPLSEDERAIVESSIEGVVGERYDEAGMNSTFNSRL